MSRSQYLAAALQGMGHPQQFQTQPMFSPQDMAQFSKRAQAYQQSDPGGSYLGHNLMQAGRNIAAVPGDAINGLQRLGASVMGPGVGKTLPQMLAEGGRPPMAAPYTNQQPYSNAVTSFGNVQTPQTAPPPDFHQTAPLPMDTAPPKVQPPPPVAPNPAPPSFAAPAPMSPQAPSPASSFSQPGGVSFGGINLPPEAQAQIQQAVQASLPGYGAVPGMGAPMQPVAPLGTPAPGLGRLRARLNGLNSY